MIGLARKIELLHRSLERAHIPHAFGGAIALAYCIEEPRATADIDLNVFVGVTQARDVFAALPRGAGATKDDSDRVAEQGQVRLRWDDTPVDLFFSYHTFHEEVAERAHTVSFETIEIPVLECGDLVVFKAIFGRTRDWVDIENVIESSGVDLDVPLQRLEALVGREDSAWQRLASMGVRSDDEGAAYRRAFGRPTQQE